MPLRFASDQSNVLLLGLLSGLLAFLISDIADANGISQARGFAFSHIQALPTPPEPVAIAPSAIIINQRAAVRIDDGIVKFFFASGKAEVANGAKTALEKVVEGVREGYSVKISEFHDHLGDPQANAELAKQRAMAVHDTLLTLGVPAERIDLDPPEITAASGSNAQASRVEVTLVKSGS